MRGKDFRDLKKKKKSECIETLSKLSPFLRTGKTHASLNFEAHPYPLGGDGLAPWHWLCNLLFCHQNRG